MLHQIIMIIIQKKTMILLQDTFLLTLENNIGLKIVEIHPGNLDEDILHEIC